MKIRKVKTLLISIFILTSCVTVADYNFHTINKALNANDFASVYYELENPNGIMYTNRDSVLENLDKGIISHYAGEFERSNQELSKAESLIEKFQAVSITQAIGSTITNDTVKDYAGDPYENIYTNIFMALNYIQLNNTEDAFVEIRRMDNKLKAISAKYRKEIESNKLALKNNAKSVPDTSMNFHNCALARYLSMLMYRSEADYDNAEVDYKYIREAFTFQKQTYNFPVPDCIKNDYKKPEGARLNVIAFTGKAPEKIEERTPLFAVDGFYRIALPVMKKRESSITSAKITAQNIHTGEVFTTRTEKLESIENIAMDTYSQKYSLVVAKTIGRMVAKLTTSVVFDEAAREVDDAGLSLIFSLAGIVSKVNMFASERADVRTSRYFPGEVHVCGLDLPPGDYQITVQYMNNKHIQDTQVYSKTVQNKGLNLLESFCLK